MTTIMLAPNGGRRGKADHPALPITMAETVACAVDAQAEGAEAVHVHLRDASGGHLLDAGAYRELAQEIGTRAPGLAVQITTESIGRYTPEQQMRVVREAEPDFASCALRELCAEEAAALAFYRDMAEAGVGIQHIIYTPEDAARLRALVGSGRLPAAPLSLIFVVGSYPDGGGTPARRLAAFLAETEGLPCAWMACAFGAGESRVLAAAMALGGHARVGFENSLQMADGSRATDNAARVREVAALRRGLGLAPGDTGAVLGRPASV